MTKDEFCKLLSEKGYTTSIDDGVVMVTLNHVPSSAEINYMLKLKEDAGYTASFGWHTKKQD